ncbi:SUMF1/EgtB/PvdO family nonheme iron enzyme [Candidatus Viridilinea mediisalina]|uniref:SUMF1/EgtB/PvdO family nonheme iron enzyme n=1 Tax=Candidatus Viridilinea mediisalina TaxID=2024553 RepID=UPI0013FD2660|nr:SUMF1/EgtB/PvdO family nonheme iron enzyme [Candidatus Viridilinea mediisalina]
MPNLPDVARRPLEEELTRLRTGLPEQPTRSHDQQVGGHASVGVAVAGSVHGHIFINGYRERSRAEVLAAYLARLLTRCAALPLQGVVGERDADDGLHVQLSHVYIQLATTALSLRERVEDDALRAFDAAAYLERHVGPALLPALSRAVVYVERVDDPASERSALALEAEPPFTLGERPDLRGGLLANFSAADLRRLVEDAAVRALTFAGPQLVTEALAGQRCVVLLGEPGSGKSTVLRYLAHRLAHAGLVEEVDPATQLDGWAAVGRLLPILVPLLPLARQLAQHPERQGSDGDLWNYLVDHLQPRGAHAGLAEAIMEEIEAGHVILLLDGLDEVAGEASRAQVVQAVRTFAEHNPPCRIVVSCRTRAYDTAINPANQQWQLPGWPTATLADLTLAQMQHFVGAWYTAVAAGDVVIAAQCTERIAELRAALSARRDLRDLGGRSLLLTIMALVHLRQRNLPEDRASLYRECVEILLARWELRGKAETEYQALMDYIGLPGVEVKALRPLLSEAAFRAHEARSPQNPGLLSADTLQVMVQEFLHTKGHPNPFVGARRFLEYTDYRAGLLHAANAGNDYQFAHMTFQEYLAGLALVGAEQPVQAILQRRNEERWRVPIFLGIGHAVSEGLPSLLRELLDELTSDTQHVTGQRDALLAAELGADVRWSRLPGTGFAKAQRELAAALADVVTGNLLPAAERVRAGELLAGLHDPRPGVCTLPPPMVEFAGEAFQIGITQAEYEAIVGQEEKGRFSKQAEAWYVDMLNITTLQIRPFALARYPVTNAQYQRFIEAGGYDPTQPWWDAAGRAWLRRDDQATEGLEPWQRRTHKQQPEWWTDPRFGKARPNHPLVGISWYEATAFCAWLTQHLRDGYVYRLPSEAEWEYAARGVQRRTYPWGEETPDGERANFNRTHNGTSAVGCFPLGATPEGILDLAGNVWEWTRSEYRSYPYDPDDGREDSRKPAKKRFTLRGGSWDVRSLHLRAAAPRLHGTPGRCVQVVGLRLARQC